MTKFVTIYGHPILERNPEGEAELIEKVRDFINSEGWLVRFRWERKLLYRRIRKENVKLTKRILEKQREEREIKAGLR